MADSGTNHLKSNLWKLKKTLITIAFTGLASSGMFYPVLASASLFSIFATASAAQPQTTPLNSQTVPLLTPARNIDPSPSVGGGDIALVAGRALLAQEGPDGTVADIIDRPQSATISVYTVHAGDTLPAIAKMFGVTSNTIVWANDLSGSTIHAGQQLVILPITGVIYTVKSGDTLASVAKKYKADVGEVAQYNNLSSDAALTAGSTIIIPDGEVPPTAAQLAQAARTKAISNIRTGKTTEPYLGGSGPALAGYYSWPVQGGVITQGLHGWNGVDIGAPTGTSIYAAAAGTVLVARSGGGWNGGYGNYVVISHPNGTQTLYAHMSRVLVSVGQQVAQGTIIGRVGATGEATGPHLHFEVRGAANPFAN